MQRKNSRRIFLKLSVAAAVDAGLVRTAAAIAAVPQPFKAFSR